MVEEEGSLSTLVVLEIILGELLSLVSAPSYNPNLLVGRERSKNYYELLNSKKLIIFQENVIIYTSFHLIIGKNLSYKES